jgi:voltage-gated potassium channel
MGEFEGDGPVAASESGERPDKLPLTARLLLRETLTARRAAAIIAGFTVLITITGAFLERIFDHKEFHTFGKGLWFALQTVTTVGYGDATPRQPSGRFIASVLMVAGIAFLAVITAAVTATLIETSRRRFTQAEVDLADRLDEVTERLARIEAGLEKQAPPRSSDGIS